MSSSKEILSHILSKLPDDPGVYQFFDGTGKIIYIGKAKNLKKRVFSYFNKNIPSAKTRIMVSKIRDLKFIVVETEQDALLLENNLIKKYQPRYNVMLKDDKTYPWICVKKEPFPRVFVTRNVVKDGSEYFGPYTSVRLVRIIMSLFKSLFKIRTCKYLLSSENIASKRFKPCLEYHIGNCFAPCIGNIDEHLYLTQVNNIRNILKGNISSVTDYMKNLMNEYSENMEFEKAHEIKEKLEHLDKFKSKSVIVNPTINNVDVFSITTHENFAFVNFLKVVNGSIIQAHTVELKRKLDETDEELLLLSIIDIRNRLNSNSREIIVPIEINTEIEGVKFIIPQRGDKKKLLDLSTRNCFYYKKEKIKTLSKPNKSENRTRRIMETMAKDLRLGFEPKRIECFDNSNIQGEYPVASCVVFINGKPAKKEYRHFNIKTVEGPNDYASMEEVIYRRYKRLSEENKPLPNLIVIDGGKGQLGSALSALDSLGLRGEIAIISIAKRLEEIYFPGDSTPLYIDKNSETLKIIQHLRDEAHRFGITFHRDKRSKGMITSELDDIKGVGEKSKSALYQKYRSIENMKNASMEDLELILGKRRANLVYEFLHKNQKDIN